jgi:adenylylsulfate kinase
VAENVVWHRGNVSREQRERQNGHRAAVIWLTGLPSSGKSTIAHAVEQQLYELGCRTFVFDGDNVRHGLCSDLGFSVDDRKENVRRIGEMAKLFLDAGTIALTAFISPFRSDRGWVRKLVGPEDFVEIYCRCPLETCVKRDVKGLYERARRNEIPQFTGVSAPYEEPLNADLVLDTADETVEASVAKVLELLEQRRVVRSGRPHLAVRIPGTVER